MTLEPTPQKFIESLSGPPLSQLRSKTPSGAVGPTGSTRIRIVRPAAAAPTDIVDDDIFQDEGERYAQTRRDPRLRGRACARARSATAVLFFRGHLA
jgi:hypothetical protein